MSKQQPWFAALVIRETGMSAKGARLLIHEEERTLKRDEARDRAKRNEAIGLNLLHDGIEEVVVAHFDPDAMALDCETVTFDLLPLWEQALVEDYERGLYDDEPESRMADWEVALLTGVDQDEASKIAWSSTASDYEKSMERIAKRERFYLSLEAEEDDEPTDWHGSEVWPPACTMHDIEENHDFFSRGFSITTRP